MNPRKLLIALIAAGSFFSTPAPAQLNALLEQVQVSAAWHGFSSDLGLAQAEAIRRASRIVLCKSADGEQCATRGAWSQGWIVFHDENGDGMRSKGEEVLLREAAFAKTVRVTGNMNAVHAVAFGPTGAAKLQGAALDSGTLTVCRDAHASGEARRVIFTAGKAPELRRDVVSGCA
jgi:type IV fimbrial biogenesis protein FimT